ncbi:hypothetical protein HN865_00980 [Candidatus Woesearchaeota archaeon]|jgi:hypothetical protein|nr:hypothetical protein [Candidatus Woesearchaeota archaeon]MBT7237410.1 hypothetical protein [Candidatus Woesearchaeota archaeon]
MISNKRLATEYYNTMSEKGFKSEEKLLKEYGFIAEYPTNLRQTYLKQGDLKGIGLEDRLDETSLFLLRHIVKKKRREE